LGIYKNQGDKREEYMVCLDGHRWHEGMQYAIYFVCSLITRDIAIYILIVAHTHTRSISIPITIINKYTLGIHIFTRSI